jgi:hypothetical protein
MISMDGKGRMDNIFVERVWLTRDLSGFCSA